MNSKETSNKSKITVWISGILTYIIAGNGDLLIDYNPERDIKFQEMPTLERLKIY